ncbi:MarR family winged helix-turn-helix transcriptional regulator [Siccirubricoccus phaeus]|uniref:MarR family winged helix-turn-helix transcriptional regulator n=1 Tax=Siccirubricoccus phaeus TaxID=2595053 RepID=UPI001A9C5200|nr:MarR family transcriptional regulator [Siccirubricoccus phaeus]
MRAYTRIMSPHCYCIRLRQATRRLNAFYDQALAPLGITIAQYSLLRMIERHQPVSLTELGRLAELDRSTIGRNVRVLEKQGLAALGPGEEDQRESMVTLSAAGRTVLEASIPVWDECQKTLEARLGPDRLRAFEEVLDAV